ncbi:hypothetical protein HD554DRAFT_2170473 [Boletus coccyginus]|nr:hypothetical protein HD554DRAFT_2170473 [Boletus coccyginus]
MAPHTEPPRKRMRLSSPTFDDQVGEPSQDDIDAFDSLDAELSQSFVRHPHGVTDDEHDDNPFLPHNESARIHTPQTVRIHAPSTIDETLELSDEADQPPPGVDYAAWFNPTNSFVGFTSATTAMPGFQRPSIKGDSAKSLFVPSTAALQEAEEKMRKWQEDVLLPDQLPTHNEPDSERSTQVASPQVIFSSARSAFSSMQAPETPTPTSLLRHANVEPTPTKSRNSLPSLASKRQTIPFKSPLIIHLGAALAPPLPLKLPPPYHPYARLRLRTTFATQKPLGFTPRHANATRPKFVTPFKVVAKSATPRAFVLENIELPPTPSNSRTIVNRLYPPSVPSSQPGKRNSDQRIFDLTPPSGRRTLAISGLRPQTYSAKQLEDMGMSEVSQVNPRTASFYTFATRSHSPPNLLDPSPSVVLGRSAVLEELHAKGCTLAKQAWVDNHWPLVLWKLAGMVILDPMSESDPLRKRWCWKEVIHSAVQYATRYERDLNSSSRPPLRLVTTRDASAESPMVLCISDIIWSPGGPEEDTAAVQTYPELEVTDGWYRLRAHIDAPLARGARKGKIKIGRKIAVAGAKLSAERKEGIEILEAYNSNVLLLTGNSTHPAPWHAKLGFQRGPFVATLNSLTADGGNVAVMMLTIIKAYPVAYIEFVKDTNGLKERVGPHDAKEELKLSTQWKTKWESHASKLWSEYEKRRHRLLDYAERLEQRAGSKFTPRHDDGPPDEIYDIYDTLQEDIEAAKSVMSSIGHEDAGWLARHIRERAVQERDEVSKEIEQELESIFPPRDVKAFCVVVVNDARTYKYPSKRTAQVTVWDVPGVSVPEGSTQSPFIPGQQYLVTNLVPTQASAWMDRFLRWRSIFEHKEEF